MRSELRRGGRSEERNATGDEHALRVVMLITRADQIGGAHLHVADLAAALRDRGHGVEVWVGGEGPYLLALAERAVPFRRLDHLTRPIRPPADLRALLEIRALLRRERPDVLSTYSAKAGLLGRLAAVGTGVPAIFTAHGWAFTEGTSPLAKGPFLLAEMIGASVADRIVTTCEFDRQLAVRHRVAPASKIVNIYNGVHDVDPGLGADPAADPPRVIAVQRFEPQKDHATLLEALAGLREQEWALDWVGDGVQLSEARSLAAELGIADRIRWLGLRSDVSELLARAQVFALTSRWEGFPFSILEAMRAGLPVVATAVAGVSESVQDGVTGFTVPREEPAAVREALARLIRDSALRVRMGEAGRSRYEERFTYDRMLDENESLLREVAREHRSSAGRAT